MTTQQLWHKPVPGISGETKPFWNAARRGEFMIQHCDNCWSQNIKHVRASGKGTVWTYTVTYQNRSPGFNEEVPYVLALVELEEGVKVFTNIIECNPRDVEIGMPVEVTFVPATPQIHVPMFKPAS